MTKISDYALIGNGLSSALIHRSGSIDWFCFPRFDSEAFMAKLVGDKKNGFCSLDLESIHSIRREYIPKTMILRTEFQTQNGSIEILDFMPNGKTALVRIARVLKGQMKVGFTLSLKAEYGKRPADRLRQEGKRISFFWNEHALIAEASCPAHKISETEVTWAQELKSGETLTLKMGDPVSTSDGPALLLEDTKKFWETWSSKTQYDGPYSPFVERSALVLKTLIYEPEGSIVAAPTTSLPEVLGQPFNWDYRFSWLRDGSFTIGALFRLKHVDEGRRFFDWMFKATRACVPPIDPGFDLIGHANDDESELSHLSGFANTKPVRIGN